jgi:hypothetical protein
MSIKQNDELEQLIKEQIEENNDNNLDEEINISVSQISSIIDKVTHHASGFNYCEECKKLAKEQGLIK